MTKLKRTRETLWTTATGRVAPKEGFKQRIDLTQHSKETRIDFEHVLHVDEPSRSLSAVHHREYAGQWNDGTCAVRVAAVPIC
jgi:hypothetical protein